MQPFSPPRQRLADGPFRDALRDVLARSGQSMRGLSLAMGRDPGYVAALLDPTRPSRARPNPDDLVGLSDATGIPLVQLLEALWAISPRRLAEELGQLDPGHEADARLPDLSPEDRRTVADFARFLAARRKALPRGGGPHER